MKFVDVGFHDGIHRAGFFAEAAIDTFEEIDVVARRASCPIIANVRLDRNSESRAYGLAEFAGDAALLPVRIAAQGMQATEAMRLRRLLFRVRQGDALAKEIARRYGQAFEQLP